MLQAKVALPLSPEIITPVAIILAALITASVTLFTQRRWLHSFLTRRSSFAATARYQWLEEQSIVWALAGQLKPETQRAIEVMRPFDPSGYRAIESALAKDDAVKIDSLVITPDFQPTFSPVQLIVQGGTLPVAIRDIRANIVTWQSPLSGTLIFGPPQGEEPVVEIAFDLDSNDTIARRLDDSGMPGKAYFADGFMTLQPSESMAFSIRAYTQEYYCEWEIEIDAVVRGKKRTLRVRDSDGRPFRTTAFAPSYDVMYELDFEQGRFVRMPPDSDVPWVVSYPAD